MAHDSMTLDLASTSRNVIVTSTGTITERFHADPPSIPGDSQSWGFDSLKAEVSLRGGGCAGSLLCNSLPEIDDEHVSSEPQIPIRATSTGFVQREEREETIGTSSRSASPLWRGWAELENDPEIFTILLQEWGVPSLQVHEIIDMAELITAQHEETLGLIFLSRYIAPDTNFTPAVGDLHKDISQPWFANQISKFSCGTVALMNILMNSQNTSLSETLSIFKMATSSFSAKDRGIALDENAKFREIHNSFSTKMDRMIVDVLLKEDAQKFKQRKAAEARQAKQADRNGNTQKKRKRKSIAGKKKKKTSVVDEEEDNGFHFVAYVPANGAVWKMDGLQSAPECLGKPVGVQTWLNVAAGDLQQKMQEAFNSGQDCSLMSISKTNSEVAITSTAEISRKQEDWAPFIEHMLRLHAEKGDLQELLGL